MGIQSLFYYKLQSATLSTSPVSKTGEICHMIPINFAIHTYICWPPYGRPDNGYYAVVDVNCSQLFRNRHARVVMIQI